MKVIDENSPASRKRLGGLDFVDFLEALCRLALQKAWPSNDVLAKSDCVDALQYLTKLKVDDPAAHRALMEERAVPWDAEPFLRPAQCIENMVKGLIREVEEGSGAKRLDGKVSIKEARAYRTVKAPPKKVKV
uniref:Uncharacterized protein n=1 Tax=Haptolina brevifila TaxID=156173 RepID=A0A7S2NT92_9EUKA|mmetsp:Transcript_9598/g.19574  ORF Transcript_9598/g.19574 Transcript_9598/m.19574 type:complete len:133 (+) Transcript_9598:563-961(+)